MLNKEFKEHKKNSKAEKILLRTDREKYLSTELLDYTFYFVDILMMESRISIFVSVVHIMITVAEDVPDCLDGFYFNSELNGCKRCSECDGNLIIRYPCTVEEDTVCGPFVEFDKFLQRPANTSYNWEDQSLPENQQTQFPTSVDKDRKWYTLAMALLGILSVISVFGVVYIVVVCFVCKKRRQDKEVAYDAGKYAMC